MDKIELRPFNLKMLRNRLCWPQIEMARFLDCSLTQLSKWELSGSCPAHLTNGKLARLAAETDDASNRTHQAPLVESKIRSQKLDQLSAHLIEEMSLQKAA